ncbi:MAG: prepilin-type N-terminal cleavage/methylation domain-containing protein [Candidatus Omnitrophica bacterium]|nr:prepilin-type N-terminal cleavage/methylation domain-containing protein [Candidatus Omnitrophota bacterium]
MKYANKKCCGFTLMEILIAMVIISIMALFVLPNFDSYKRHQELRKVKNDLVIIQGAMTILYKKVPSFPCESLETVEEINQILNIELSPPTGWTYTGNTFECTYDAIGTAIKGFDTCSISRGGPPDCI